MGIRDVEDGVVRISMLHYNSPEEVDRLLNALTVILAT
jgi:selenocysteine lyase/cysteine desulfurase